MSLSLLRTTQKYSRCESLFPEKFPIHTLHLLLLLPSPHLVLVSISKCFSLIHRRRRGGGEEWRGPSHVLKPQYHPPPTFFFSLFPFLTPFPILGFLPTLFLFPPISPLFGWPPVVVCFNNSIQFSTLFPLLSAPPPFSAPPTPPYHPSRIIFKFKVILELPAASSAATLVGG